MFTRIRTIIFRSVFNPVDYDGRMIREIKDSYRTNELGFFIVVAFIGALSHSFASYRRLSLLN